MYNKRIMKYVITLFLLIELIGCSAPQIRDDGYIIISEGKNVEVQALHAQPFKYSETAPIDIWHIRVANTSSRNDWCVGIEWQTLDFIMNVPNHWFFVPAMETLDIGTAVQQTWQFDGSAMTFDDAGFMVYRLLLNKPENNRCI